VGIGACAAEGVKSCDPTGSATICEGMPAAAGEESCNGIDDDCDGTNDEGFGVGGFCEVGVGSCKRNGATICSPDGQVGCSVNPGIPSDELCNGIDDNCNGEIDEGNPESGDACNSGLDGVCRAGVRNCLGGRLQCVPDIQPGTQSEECDGLDNDCNGVPDDVVQALLDGNGVPLLDEDGNAQTIQRGSPCTNGLGACNRQGFYSCEIGVGLLCNADPGPPGEELCNGADDDCDGALDERAFPRVDIEGEENLVPGANCVIGQGECAGPGVSQCSLDTLGVVCVGDPETASVETCNGLDDDCDGQIDERNPQGDANCTIDGQLGECALGRTQCQGGNLNCVPTNPNPEIEVCDGLDTDCDGKCLPGEGCDDDTDLVTTQDPDCSVGDGLCERDGTLVCDMNLNTLVCNANPGTPNVELCDALDNDCDGVSDENNPEGGMSCAVPGQRGRCASGVTVCQNAGRANVDLICQQGNNPVAEVCNGEDDNCNGLYDEGYGVWTNENARTANELVANTCSRGLGLCYRDGIYQCSADGQSAECSALDIPGAASDTICNMLDDDCDGLTDEDALYYGWSEEPIPAGVSVWLNPDAENSAELVGRSCAEGCGPCRNAGVLACGPSGGVYCTGVQDLTQTVVENCDGIDGNCDCVGDWEQYTEDSGDACTPLSPGRLPSACSEGSQTCEGGPGGVNIVCTSNVEPGSQPEMCDGINNDCDGSIDEGASGTGSNCDVEGALGVCSAGTSQCTTEGDIICTGNIPATPETCDGLDNDCDGDDDEDFNVGGVCDSSFFLGTRNGQGICSSPNCRCYAVGLRECVSDDDPATELNEVGTVTCTAEMPVQPDELSEACDGSFIDEDCDGFVDEGFDLLNDLNNCGSCGNVCSGADPECIEGECFRTYWLDPELGSNTSGSGTSASPWRTLRYATDQVDGENSTLGIPAARIYLKPGRYARRDKDPVSACDDCGACACGADEECKSGAAAPGGTGCYLVNAELELFPVSPSNTIQIVGAGETPGEVIIDGGTLACFEDPFGASCTTTARSANIGPIFAYTGADDVRGKTDCQTVGARKAYCAQQPFMNQDSYGTRNLIANLTMLRTPARNSETGSRFPTIQLQNGSNLMVQDTILDYGDSTGAASLASVTTNSELVVDRMTIRRTPTPKIIGISNGGKFYGHALSVFNSSVAQTASNAQHRRAFFQAVGADTIIQLENSVFANNAASIMQVGNAAKGLMMHCSVANLDSGYAVLVDSGSLQTTVVNNAFYQLRQTPSTSDGGGGLFLRKDWSNLSVRNNLFYKMDQASGGRAAAVYSGGTITNLYTPANMDEYNTPSFGTGNFEGDPKFLAPGNNNLTLTDGSQCVKENSGANGPFDYCNDLFEDWGPILPVCPEKDRIGTQRSNRGVSPDIGAFESLVDP
jgi:hypothetical protein